MLNLTWLFVGISSDYGCWNTEKSVSLKDSDFQTFLEGEENKNGEKLGENKNYS